MVKDTILVELQMEVIDRHRPSSRRGLAEGLNFTEMRGRLDDMRFLPLHWAAYMVRSLLGKILIFRNIFIFRIFQFYGFFLAEELNFTVVGEDMKFLPLHWGALMAIFRNYFPFRGIFFLLGCFFGNMIFHFFLTIKIFLNSE
jgi:hypothetical protein